MEITLMNYETAKRQEKHYGRLFYENDDGEFYEDFKQFSECWDSKRFYGKKIGIKYEDNFFGALLKMNYPDSQEFKMKLPFGIFKDFDGLEEWDAYDYLEKLSEQPRYGGRHEGKSYFQVILKYYEKVLRVRYPKLQDWGEEYTASLYAHFLLKTARGMAAEAKVHNELQNIEGYKTATGEDERSGIDAFITIEGEVYEISIKSGAGMSDSNCEKYTQNNPRKFFIGYTDAKNCLGLKYYLPKQFKNKGIVEKSLQESGLF